MEPIEAEVSDYATYRGKCKEMSEALIAADNSLSLVRGYYHCPIWGKQAHWWVKKPDGTIIDPTKNQFPSKGLGTYEEYDGTVECAECGKVIQEEDANIVGRYAFCSYTCHGRFVGVL